MDADQQKNDVLEFLAIWCFQLEHKELTEDQIVRQNELASSMRSFIKQGYILTGERSTQADAS